MSEVLQILIFFHLQDVSASDAPIFTTQTSVLLKDDEAPEEVEEVVEPRPFQSFKATKKNT
jgi:hypothetical protein